MLPGRLCLTPDCPAGQSGACLAPHALGWAECSFPGTQTHRNCFQRYFYFAKINNKLLKDPFSRSKLEMAIISQACSTRCCAELPRALQGISGQAVPSIRQTFTGALLATTEGIAAGRWRFTGSRGGDRRPCEAHKGQGAVSLGQAAPSSIHQPPVLEVNRVRAGGTTRDDGGSTKPAPAPAATI